MNTEQSGCLYIVSTPIGNLEDITYRAVRILSEVDVICAEDTRVTGKLLKHYEIENRMLSYYAHNAKGRIPQVLEMLHNGQHIAVVSDAGTPGISDPSERLVSAAAAEGIRIIPIPGACAAITALVVSGIPTDRFVFEGFLPKKKGRQTRFKLLAEEERTIVVYESPHRIQKTLEDIVKHMGNRYIVVLRELTKRYEEIIRGSAVDLVQNLSSRKLKGEIVLLVAGNKFDTTDPMMKELPHG